MAEVLLLAVGWGFTLNGVWFAIGGLFVVLIWGVSLGAGCFPCVGVLVVMGLLLMGWLLRVDCAVLLVIVFVGAGLCLLLGWFGLVLRWLVFFVLLLVAVVVTVCCWIVVMLCLLLIRLFTRLGLLWFR